MTREELKEQRRSATTHGIWEALRIVDTLFTFRCQPAMDDDNMPELDEIDYARLVYIRDRAEQIIRADREQKEGKRAA